MDRPIVTARLIESRLASKTVSPTPIMMKTAVVKRIVLRQTDLIVAGICFGSKGYSFKCLPPIVYLNGLV